MNLTKSQVIVVALAVAVCSLGSPRRASADEPHFTFVPTLAVSRVLTPAPSTLTLRSSYLLPLSDDLVEVGGEVLNGTLEEYYDLVIRVVLRDGQGAQVGSATGRVLAHAAPSWGTAPFLFTVPVSGPASSLELVPVSYRTMAEGPRCESRVLQLEQDWGNTTGRYTESGLIANTGTQTSYDIRIGLVVQKANADGKWILDRIVLAQLGKDELEPGEYTTYAIELDRPSGSVALSPINTGRYRDVP